LKAEDKDNPIVKICPWGEQAQSSSGDSYTVAHDSVHQAEITQNSSETEPKKRNCWRTQSLRKLFCLGDNRKWSKKELLKHAKNLKKD
jgi:hypothetical protein